MKKSPRHEIVLVCGYPASGKTETTQDLVNQGYCRLNRDTLGGKTDDLLHHLETYIMGGQGSFVLDNLFVNKAARKPFIDKAKRHGLPIRCMLMGTSIEDAQYNACLRMIAKKGKVLTPEELKGIKDPNLFPPAVLFAYRKDHEPPTVAEGFEAVEVVPFARRPYVGHDEMALILDQDGCLVRSRTGSKWPTGPDDVETLPGRAEVLKKFLRAGYRLLGASNKSMIAKGDMTAAEVEAVFKRTNEMLGVKMEISYCPHKVPPINCYCRKPMPGMLVEHIVKYKLDPKRTIFVGDMTTDKTCAARAGVLFANSDDFFGGAYERFLK